MKQKYYAFWFSIGTRQVLDEIVRIAESDPEVILTYYRQDEQDSSVALDKFFEFGIMVPKSKMDEYRELEEMDWSDTDCYYDFEPEPYMYARNRIILSDLRRLVAISDELEDIRKKYVGSSISPAEVDRLAKDEVAERKCAIANGPHWFSGIQEFHIDEDEDTFSQLDGYAIEIDGKIYLAVEDPSDGYRSYAYLRDVVPSTIGIEINNHFEPQKVYAETKHETIVEDGWTSRDAEVFRLKNQYGQTVLEISTDYAEDYYPVGSVRYFPENLPCNAKPLLN
jgi:hypothetical protein